MPRTFLWWLPPRLRERVLKTLPYVPYNPKPEPPPPYVPPPASQMRILSPTAGSTSSDATPTIVGSAPGAGAVTILVKQGTTTVQTLSATPDANKAWQQTAATLSNGNYQITATQGSESAGPVAFTVTVSAPVQGVHITSPASGSTSQVNTPIFVGTAGSNNTVTVLIKQGLTTVQTLTATPTTGTWQTAPSPALAEGVYQITAQQTVSGTVYTDGPNPFTVDVPQAAVAVSSVGGQVQGGQTTDTTPTIVGTASNRAGDATTVTVTILFNNSTVQTLTGVPVTGTSWTVTPTTPLAPQFGWYVARATQASSYGNGTSSDFAFTVAGGTPLPTPTITTPTEGQGLSGNPVSFSGNGSTRSGDGVLMTLKVYVQGSTTPTATQSVQRLATGPWSLTLSATLASGSWKATVEQSGSAGLGVSPNRNFSMSLPVPPSGGFAMPRGPVSGNAGAADFYDSVGVCHHPNYFHDGGINGPAVDASLRAIQELGLRHVRLGLDSPATHGNDWWTQQYLMRERTIRGANQPIHAIFGTPGPPAQRRNQGYEIYTATDTDGTFLRPLDGPPGAVGAENWTVAEGGGKKYSAGTFYDLGWEACAALQGPNEPVSGYENGFESVRWILHNLKSAKDHRPNENVLSGLPYINFNTGRITTGPAKGPQVPCVAFSRQQGTNESWGDYANRQDVDVGCMHNYWGGHSPMYDEQWALSTGSRWGQADMYNGAMVTGAVVTANRFVNPLPIFVTETGYIQRPGSDPGSGQRYCPPDVSGEYLVRTFVINYGSGVCKRTYVFSLHDASEGALTGGGRMGLCGNVPSGSVYTSNFDRRASFYAIKNLMQIVGFVQPTNPVPITVPMTFTLGAPQSMPSKTNMADRLDQLILQRTDNEYLIILCRQRQLWNRDAQTYMVPAASNAVLTLPSGTWTCSIAEPAKQAVGSPENPTSDPPDGQTYANPTDGTAFAAAGTAGNGFTQSGNTLTVRMGGLVRVIKAVKQTGTPTPTGDNYPARVVNELNRFGNWCSAYGVAGVVGEFAVPTNTHAPTVRPADATAWAALLETYYQRMQYWGLSSMQWVASEVSVGENQTYYSPAYGTALNERMASAGPLENHAADPGVRRGIALTGLEFGTSGTFSNTNPGTLHSTYYAASQGSWNYLASRGVRFARVGFRWERLQPQLGQVFNTTYLGEIQRQALFARNAGIDICLDCHNYGEYQTSAGILKLGSAGLTSAHFNNLWTRLAQTFAADDRVVAYGIMNEPNGLPGGNAGWQTLSQSCVSAIRTVDSSTPIFVSGHAWGKVQDWTTNHPVPWITGANVAYEAHHYFDTESSGDVGGPAADSVYDQTYASAEADSTPLTDTVLDDPTWRPYSLT